MFFSETGQTFQPNQTNCYSLLPEIQIAKLTPRDKKKHQALVRRKFIVLQSSLKTASLVFCLQKLQNKIIVVLQNVKCVHL